MTLWWTSEDVGEAHMVPATKAKVLHVVQPLSVPCPAHLIPDASGEPSAAMPSGKLTAVPGIAGERAGR